LYPGVSRTEPADLDLEFHYGRLVIEGSHAMPFLVVREGATPDKGVQPTADEFIERFRMSARANPNYAAIVLEVTMEPDGIDRNGIDRDGVLHRLPWTPTQPEPAHWPLVGVASRTSPWVMAADELPVERALKPGRYAVGLRIFSTVKMEGSGDWRLHTLSEASDQRRSFHRQLKTFNIEEGQILRLRAEMPADYEKKLLQLTSQDPNWPSLREMRVDNNRRPIPPHELFVPQPLELTLVEEKAD
jgi:hypothetical protein